MEKRRTVMRAVSRLKRAWQEHGKAIAQEEGVPDSYRQIVMFLHRHPGALQRSIADFCGVTASAVNQTVQGMLRDGYLRKEEDPADRRCFRIYLTEKGEQVARRLFLRLSAADDAISARLSAEREAELIETLDSLADFIREELHGC